MGYVVIEDGTLAPVAVFLGFIPMLLTAFAYRELNRVIPDCGTTFTWVTKAFGPRTGWFSGWVLTLAGIIVLANLAQVAAQYTFLLIGADSLAENTFLVTLLGVVFIAVMAWVSYRGIQIAHWLQNVLVGIQYLALGVLVVVALIAVAGPNRPDTATPIEASWFNPLGFFGADGGGFAALTESMLLMVFIYWGWDTILSLNEETQERDKTPSPPWRRSRTPGSGPKASGWATRTTQATCSRRSASRCSEIGAGSCYWPSWCRRSRLPRRRSSRRLAARSRWASTGRSRGSSRRHIPGSRLRPSRLCSSVGSRS
jgi:amino acid transporter